MVTTNLTGSSDLVHYTVVDPDRGTLIRLDRYPIIQHTA